MGKLCFLYIISMSLNLFAMDKKDDFLTTASQQFFKSKKNNLNQASCDLSGTNIYSEKFFIIWVPNSAEYFHHYQQNGIILQEKTSRDQVWIRARLPALWTIESQKIDHGTYRIIKDQHQHKKLGISHYLVTDEDLNLFQTTQVVAYFKGKVKI